MSIQWLVENEIGLYRAPATVGIIKGETGWIFIDSGVEADVPKKIIKALSLMQTEVPVISAVINTHAHADHCGGNKWIKGKYNAKIISSFGEKPYIENPFLEPHYLFSAESPKALKNKFFQAEPSLVDQSILFESGSGASEVAIVDGIALKFINIKGHSYEMMGVLTASGYFYCGDLLFTPMILEKHPMLFLHDYQAYKTSLEWVKTQRYKGIILTHGGYFEDHLPLAEATLNRLEMNRSIIFDTIKSPMNEWDIHWTVADIMALDENFGGWHLNHGVIRSYLGYGLEQGLLNWEKGLYSPIVLPQTE